MKTTISENQLNKIILESIKKVLKEENGDPYRRTRVDFTKMPFPPKNLEYNGELQDIKSKLEKGTFNGGENKVYDALVSMGYTQEEVAEAYKNGAITKGGLDANNNYQFEKGSNNPSQDRPTGKLMTLEDFAYEADLNVNVGALLKRWGLQPNSKTDANGWKQIFKKNAGLFKNNPGVMDSVRNYNPDFNPFEKTGKEDYDNMKVGKTGNYALDPNNLNNITEIIHRIQSVYAQGGDKDANFTDLFDDSTGIFNTPDVKGKVNPEQVRQQIMRKMKQAANTLKIVNPDTKETYYQMLEGWLNGTRPYRQREIAQCLSAIGTVIDTSRNEIPPTRGLQKALNYFNIKDSKGRKFAVDGVIGPETSAALKNAGFKDIYEWKQTIYNYQQKYNVPPKPDGLVGDNTIDSFRSNGISSLQQLNLFKPERIANQEKWNSYGRVNVDMPKPNVTMATQPQPGIGRPGFVAESKKNLVSINEEKLIEIISESVKENIVTTLGNQAVKLGTKYAPKVLPKIGKTKLGRAVMNGLKKTKLGKNAVAYRNANNAVNTARKSVSAAEESLQKALASGKPFNATNLGRKGTYMYTPEPGMQGVGVLKRLNPKTNKWEVVNRGSINQVTGAFKSNAYATRVINQQGAAEKAAVDAAKKQLTGAESNALAARDALVKSAGKATRNTAMAGAGLYAASRVGNNNNEYSDVYTDPTATATPSAENGSVDKEKEQSVKPWNTDKYMNA